MCFLLNRSLLVAANHFNSPDCGVSWICFVVVVFVVVVVRGKGKMLHYVVGMGRG